MFGGGGVDPDPKYFFNCFKVLGNIEFFAPL